MQEVAVKERVLVVEELVEEVEGGERGWVWK